MQWTCFRSEVDNEELFLPVDFFDGVEILFGERVEGYPMNFSFLHTHN